MRKAPDTTIRADDAENTADHRQCDKPTTARTAANKQFCSLITKYPSFCYFGNMGPSERSCNDTVKSTDPENPVWYQNQEIISYRNRVIVDTAVTGLKENLTGSRSPLL